MEDGHPLARALEGRYDLGPEIGAGGMATVYRAKDLRHGRSVAIKVLRPAVAEAIGANRFLREIEIAASLSHPHILPLYDSGRAGDTLYFVMPFVEGESLRTKLARDGALPIPDAIRMFREILDALAFAHAGAVVHRDIKPANILLSGGHALIADFGVARALGSRDDDSRLTATGVSLGTPRYMAPEQALGEPDLDHRADLFSAGAVAYEMLTGLAPFEAESTRGTYMAVISREPAPPHRLRKEVPESLSRVVMRCLEKTPSERPPSAGAVLAELEAIVGRGAPRASARMRRGLVAAVAGLVATGGLFAWSWSRSNARAEWASVEAIPAVERLIGENRVAEAAQLALEAEALVGPDPRLERLWPLMAGPFRITTDPPGAAVEFRPYGSGAWQSLGRTPFESERFPSGIFRFRITLDGYEVEERVRSLIAGSHLATLRNSAFDYLEDPSYAIDLALAPRGSRSDGMVEVRGGLYGTVPVLGFGAIQPVSIPTYRIQRTEVTNAQFADFVDAGGYADSTLWTQPVVLDHGPASWAAAAPAWVDATGRPGPSGWRLGRPPQGAQTMPVEGVSWYEADAYCRWRGWSLPTLAHWARATLPSSDVWQPFNDVLARASRFGGDGPLPVGTGDAPGISGAQDLAGNVREWGSTAVGETRLLYGGAWSDPTYRISDVFGATPGRRDAGTGFRCVDILGTPLPAGLTAALDPPDQDLDRRVRMSDEEFAARSAFYTYSRELPLEAVLDSIVDLDWGARVEWATITTAYGERMSLRLHVPTEHPPPHAAIIFFPGGDVVRSAVRGPLISPLDELVRSGRVLVTPAYDGTYERNDGRTLARAGGPGRAQLFANWVMDLGRTIDYLTERPDVDGDRVSYLGLSLGAGIMPRLLPFEPRFRAAILYSGGIGVLVPQASVDEYVALAGRVRTPVLQLGGSHDFSSPVRHQRALFDALGTAAPDKRFRVFDSGHWPLPTGEVLRETVDFLDRHAASRPAS